VVPHKKLAADVALPSGSRILCRSRLQQDEAVRTAPHLRLGSPCRLSNSQRFSRPISIDCLSLLVNFPDVSGPARLNSGP